MKWILPMLMIFAFACSSQNMAGYEKLDSALQKRIDELSGAKDVSPIQVIAKLKETPGAEVSSAMENTGVTVETVVGKIVTASGSANAILKLAALDMVEHIQLSQIRPNYNQ